VQNILGRLTTFSWKLKAGALTLWWAVIAYGTLHQEAALILCVLALVPVVFVFDLSLRLAEEKFLLKSVEIEKALTAFVRGDKDSISRLGISTNIDQELGGFFLLILNWKRFRFWLPYVLVFMVTLGLWFCLRTSAPIP
jgi:hypothetical protein